MKRIPIANSAEGYIETVKRALERGWNKENIGSHIVRNNAISDCEQVGICGSLGGIYSTIENNTIFNIYTKRLFAGPETAGIKIHASIDMFIKNNRVVNTGKGIWLDWMAQGARVTANLCYNNDMQDFYSEVNHGPYLVDNNLFVSLCSVWDMSQGGAYAHNLMGGRLNMSPHSRFTPYHLPHSTEIAGYHEILGGDYRFINNIFLKESELNMNQGNPELKTRLRFGREDFGLSAFNKPALQVVASGNAYLNGALPFEKENDHLELSSAPKLQIEENEKGIFLSFDFDEKLVKMKNKIVTTELLGETLISKQTFVNPDNSQLIIEADYSGNKRDKNKNMKSGKVNMIVVLIAFAFIYSSCKTKSPETETTSFGYIFSIVKKEFKEDWKTTLAKTVEYGFTEIEAVSAPDSTVSIEEVLAYCKEIGLKPIAGGINLTEDTTEVHEKLKELKQMNLQYAVSWWPWHVSAPFKKEDCEKSARMMNFIGKIAWDEYNIQLCWHNHDHEFKPMEDGTLPFDYLMQNTDPDFVKCEIDVYWVAKGGADPVEMLQKYPGRYAIIHLKDMNPKDSSITCVGNGNIDFPAILKESKKQEVKHFLVEYDKVVNGLSCLQTAGKYLKTITE